MENEGQLFPGGVAHEAGRGKRLHHALNAAAATIHRSVLSEAEVFKAFNQQVAKLHFFGSVCLLDESKSHLVLRTIEQPSQRLEKFEEQGRLQAAGFRFPVTQVEVFRQVISGGNAIFVDDYHQVLSQFIPQAQQTLAQDASQVYGGLPAIFAPLRVESCTLGVMSITGEGLSPQDIPALEAFADHLAIALENARLISKLRKDQASYQSLFHSSLAGMLVVDLDTLRIASANQKFLEITHYSIEEVLAMPLPAFYAPEAKAAAQQAFEQVIEQGQGVFEFALHRKDGQNRLVEISITSLELNRQPMAQGLVYDITERKELEKALRHRADELTAVHNVSLQITAAQELPALLNTITVQAIRLLNCAGGSFYLCDRDKQEATCAVSYHDKRDYTGTTMKYGEGAAGFVAQTGKPLIIDDYRTWPGRAAIYEDEVSFRTMLSAPVIWQGQVTGVINVLHYEESWNFTQTEQETLTLFASQAAIAIENARLLQAERQRRDEAEMLRQASAALTSTLDLEKVLDSIFMSLEKVVPYDSAALLLKEDGYLHAVAGRGFPELNAVVGQNFPVDNGLFVQLQRTGRSIILPDTSYDPRFEHWGGTYYVKSWMGVPLILQGEVIGYLTCDNQKTGAYQETDARLAEIYANQAAVAIENARLFEAVGKRAAELEAIRQASLSLTSSLELHQVLDTILKCTLSLLPEADNSHVFLYDADGSGSLTFGAALWQEKVQKKPWSEPRPNGLTYSVVRSGETIVVSDMTNHPLFASVDPSWTGAIIGLPLKIGQRVVGVMNTSYRKVRNFPETELRLLRLLGDQAAIAIENARLFEQAATERRRLALIYDISREIVSSLDPDEILQRAITLTCEAMDGLYGEGFLYLPEESRFTLRSLYGRETGWLPILEEQLARQPGKSVAGWMVNHRQPVNIADVREDPRWLHVMGIDEEVQSALMVPIEQGEHLLGMLNVLHSKKAAFSDEHVALMQAISQEVGLALSNASRYQQVQRRLAEITLIQNLAQIFSQRLELQVLLDEVVLQLGQRLGYPQVEIYLRAGEFLILRAFYGIPPKIRSQTVQEGVLGRVARSGEALLVLDIHQDPDYSDGIGTTQSQLAVPILIGKELVGVINIQADQPEQLTAQDLDLLQVLAGQISVAIDNAALFERVLSHAEELENEVSQRTAELTELYKLSQEIAYQLSSEELLKLLLRHLRAAVRAELAAGSFRVQDNHSLCIETSRPIGARALEKIRSRWSKILAQNEGYAPETDKIRIETIQAEDFQDSNPPLLEIESIIQAPVLVEQKMAGLLMAACEEDNAFGMEQERLLTTLANQAATAIQRLEAVLAAQQEHLESLVEHMPVGTLLLDHDFNLLVSNHLGRQIVSILNGSPVEGTLTHLGAVTIQELLARQQDPLPAVITLEGPPSQVFTAQIRPVGETSLEATASREKRQWVLTVREVTQEQENQARIQGQERLATVGQLAAGIAHDFNNIMSAILVYADLLSNDTRLPPDGREKLSIIQQQVQRAASLIRQILDFSRKSVMEQSSLDILPFIKELDKLLVRVLPETIHLELTYQPGGYWINADPSRLQQVFMNLALNARDAMPDGGILRFDLGRLQLSPGELPPFPNMPPGDWIRITVTDTGTGIPAEVRKHIFEPFYTTKPVGHGTGLGLAQVYGIIKQHEGYIVVESEPGEGASFSIYLPALPAVQKDQFREDREVQLDGRGETVLVVEDDETTREVLRTLFEEHNYRVLSAANGIEALEQFEQAREMIRLVVSDVVMPYMGGVQLYRILMRSRPETKILFITGHPMEGESQALLEKGEVHWLQKPFSVQEFSRAVQNLLKNEP